MLLDKLKGLPRLSCAMRLVSCCISDPRLSIRAALNFFAASEAPITASCSNLCCVTTAALAFPAKCAGNSGSRGVGLGCRTAHWASLMSEEIVDIPATSQVNSGSRESAHSLAHADQLMKFSLGETSNVSRILIAESAVVILLGDLNNR